MTTCAGPFTAATPGALPADGPFTIAGIELPSGHRTSTGNVWVTDQPTQHAAALWAELAEHYEETGLWPLLYNVTPDRLDPAAVAQSDASAEHLLRDWWQRDIEDLRANIEPDEFDLFTQGYARSG